VRAGIFLEPFEQPLLLREEFCNGSHDEKDSLTLSIAGWLRFLTLIQSGDRPAL
jgi:hypothetical protein